MADPLPVRQVVLLASICISTPSLALLLSSEKIKSTADGICMYELPSKYNVGLLNQTWDMPEPVPHEITGVPPPFVGTYDTDQFSLDRVFFDRMSKEATFKRRPQDCKLFYVPYFALWETCHFGPWVQPHRPSLDNEVVRQLKYLGKFRKPIGVDHFLTFSRVETDFAIFNNPWYSHMKKLIIEARYYQGHPNVHAVPYPAWFRYNPSLGTKSKILRKPPTIRVTSATFDVEGACATKFQSMPATSTLTKVCDGESWCSFQLPNNAGGCAIKAMHGQYKCSSNDTQQVAFHKYMRSNPAVVLGCSRGPCWLWGDCHKRVGIERSGPLAVFIGSSKPHERDRNIIIEHCLQRPGVCALYDTSHRATVPRNFKLRPDDIVDMNEVLNSAVFCINPPGDTPTRKGLFDSMLAGCIPVITNSFSLNMYKWHLPKWTEVSVLLNHDDLKSGRIHAIDTLSTISEAEIRRKQDAIRKVAFSLQYSVVPSKDRKLRPDAFDVAISNMLQESKSEYNAFVNLQPVGRPLLRSTRNSTA